ncbi:RNA methyltransferase [Macleaya cordata]|uniref:RNA methyltransferase n=1 Tax=Macleaya cordata TaxID=56857 RepID=A0A200QF55_MACCD|nr:RNA methyltransferase [Macleaya cordata]
MAVSSLSSSSIHSLLSPHRTTTTAANNNKSFNSISLLYPPPHPALKEHRRRSSIIICSSYTTNASNDLSSEEKKVLLERYGYDHDDYLSQTFSKTRRRKETEKTGRRNRVPPEEPKPARTTHKLLQVLGGKARRMKLLSPKGMDVRPMMEVVKGAAFDILQVAGGCPASLRPGRWLDLYSGTGSVGIEAISRGCSEVHFVEMDPWVVSEVLRPNLEWTGFLDNSVIHTIRVESFLERAEQFVGKHGSFDYISVTPPYTAVDYSVLMSQISESALVGENTFIVVEYALRTDMLDSCGSLVKVAVFCWYLCMAWLLDNYVELSCNEPGAESN